MDRGAGSPLTPGIAPSEISGHNERAADDLPSSARSPLPGRERCGSEANEGTLVAGLTGGASDRTAEDRHDPMIVHLVDGTYELFRHFYGLRRFVKGADPPLGAVLGVVRTVLKMYEEGATHLGVATDHVIESFRNERWPGYKTGEGVEPVLRAQFEPLEEALRALGTAVWPMVELEADDGLASAARLAADDERVEKICIWTTDKDLAQCVADGRVVQVDRRTGRILDDAGVRDKFGVPPRLIADYLALVGDAADGYPGIAGIGAKTAARVLNRYGPIEDLPPQVLDTEDRERALLFKDLATLRTNAALFEDVEDIRWRGPTTELPTWAERLGDARLVERCRKALARSGAG